MSDNVTLSRNQKRALTAILTNKSITDAAQACGLAEKTLYRYLEDKDFRQALTQAEGDAIEQATRRLISGQDQALDTLESLLTSKDTSDTNKRLAAVAWLDLVLRWRELRNVEERIAALEEAVYHGKSN